MPTGTRAPFSSMPQGSVGRSIRNDFCHLDFLHTSLPASDVTVRHTAAESALKASLIGRIHAAPLPYQSASRTCYKDRRGIIFFAAETFPPRRDGIFSGDACRETIETRRDTSTSVLGVFSFIFFKQLFESTVDSLHMGNSQVLRTTHRERNETP